MNRGVTLLIVGMLALNTVWLADLSQHGRWSGELSRAQLDQIRTVVRDEGMRVFCAVDGARHFAETGKDNLIAALDIIDLCYDGPKGSIIRTDE